MAFENTPNNVETGDYNDASVSQTTDEVWITVDVQTEDGNTEKRAFGFIVIPKEEVPYATKSEKVQKAAQMSRGGRFNAMEYYISMLEYQIQETSFGAEDRLRTWLKTEANSDLVEELEERVVPAPLGEDDGEEKIIELVTELMEDYAETDGDYSDSLEQFRNWLKSQTQGDDREGN